MAMPRKTLTELALQNSPNLSRALKHRATSKRDLTKRADLEKMYAQITARREDALADVAARGLVITVTSTTSKGKLYQKTISNPAVKIATTCEKQLVEISRLLAQYSDCEPDAAQNELPANAIGNQYGDLIEKLQKEVSMEQAS